MDLYTKKKFITNFIYIAIWILLFYFIFKVALIYLFPFLIGVIIAYFVQKPAFTLEKKFKIPKRICASLLSIVFFVIIVTTLILIIWMLLSQGNKIIKSSEFQSSFNNIIENISSLLSNNVKNFDFETGISIDKFIKETLNEFVKKLSLYFSTIITHFFKKLPSIFISCVITIVSTCYISKDFDRLILFFIGFIGEKTQKTIIKIKNIFINSFLKFLSSYIWIFFITFVELLIGLLLLNVPHFITVAFIISLMDLLPIIGTGTVLIPWTIIEIFQYNYFKGIGFLILYLIIVVVRNIIEPKIIGNQIDINPLFTLIFIFIGLKLGGFVGMIVLPIIFTVAFNYFRQQAKDS